MLLPACAGSTRDRPRLEVEEGQARLREDQVREVGLDALVGHEDDLLSVGRVARLLGQVAVVGQPFEHAPVGAHAEEVAAAAALSAEDDPLAVGGEGRAQHPVESESDAPQHLAVADALDRERVAPVAQRHEDHRLPVGRPVHRAAEEAQALEVGLALALHQPPLDSRR